MAKLEENRFVDVIAVAPMRIPDGGSAEVLVHAGEGRIEVAGPDDLVVGTVFAGPHPLGTYSRLHGAQRRHPGRRTRGAAEHAAARVRQPHLGRRHRPCRCITTDVRARRTPRPPMADVVVVGTVWEDWPSPPGWPNAATGSPCSNRRCAREEAIHRVEPAGRLGRQCRRQRRCRRAARPFSAVRPPARALRGCRCRRPARRHVFTDGWTVDLHRVAADGCGRRSTPGWDPPRRPAPSSGWRSSRRSAGRSGCDPR